MPNPYREQRTGTGERGEHGRLTADTGVGQRWAAHPQRTELKAAWLEAYADTGNTEEARKRVGLAHRTLWQWIDGDPEFAEDYRTVLRSLEGRVIGTLYQRATNPDAGMAGNVAAFGWGKRMFPEHWSEKHLVVAGDDTVAQLLRQQQAMLAARTVDGEVLSIEATDSVASADNGLDAGNVKQS